MSNLRDDTIHGVAYIPGSIMKRIRDRVDPRLTNERPNVILRYLTAKGAGLDESESVAYALAGPKQRAAKY